MKPILFNTEMVMAILDNRKTVTRRLIKPKYSNTHLEMFTNKYGTRLIELQNDVEGETFGKNEDGSTWRKLLGMRETECDHKPYQVGDILYVRETFCKNQNQYFYKADNICNGCTEDGTCLPRGIEKHITCKLCESLSGFIKWKPSLHMPRVAARIFLKVKDVRVERLSDMAIKDMITEGVNTDGLITSSGIIKYRVINRWEELWDSTIKKSELNKYGRDANPYVWVIEFERISKEESQ
jgi:hypothetical protein